MLPQYEISGLLGRGGMGAVYRGRQAKLDRDVAIKVLPETFTKGEDELNFAKRFEQETRAMAKLDHPAITTVFDFGETPQGQLYFVMEFVDGMDISQYLRLHDGVIPQEHALAIVAHVLDALAYAHANGIVHRDIKPANILLNQQGRVKIADFGLAKRFGEHAADDGSALTMSNVAVGTPVFVAPEALEGSGPVDQRADLHAVGVMLYQLLTGKLPRGNFSPASHLNSAIDPRLDSVLAKAMESDPSRRYSSAEDLRADLDAILSGPVPVLESGDDTRVAPAAVPVDTILRGRKPRAPVRKEKSGISSAWIAIGVGALVLVGAVYLISTRARAPETLPVAAKERLLEAKPGAAMVARDSGTTDDPAKATKERPFVNSLGIKFVPVPGTKVLLCVHETRWKDYAAYAAETPGVDPAWEGQGIDRFTDSIPPQSLVPGAVEKGAQEPWIDGLAAWWNGAKDNECFTREPDGTTHQICDFATLAPKTLPHRHACIYQVSSRRLSRKAARRRSDPAVVGFRAGEAISTVGFRSTPRIA